MPKKKRRQGFIKIIANTVYQAKTDEIPFFWLGCLQNKTQVKIIDGFTRQLWHWNINDWLKKIKKNCKLESNLFVRKEVTLLIEKRQIGHIKM